MATILNKAENQKKRLGADLKLPISGSFEPINGVCLVIQDIQQLLLTIPGERVHRPTWGSGLNHLIWENVTVASEEGKKVIESSINKFEPRVKVTQVEARATEATGLVTFLIRFTILSTDTPVNLIFPFRVGTDVSFV